MAEVTFRLKVTPAIFAHWLVEHTKNLSFRHFPLTEDVYVVLQTARVDNHLRWVRIEGVCIRHHAIGEAQGEYIRFDMLPIEDGMKVKGRTLFPVYFAELLSDIAEDFPSSRESIEKWLGTADNAQSDTGKDGEGQATEAKPTKKRKGDERRERLSQFLNETELTTAELAKTLDVDESTINRDKRKLKEKMTGK
jgi:hypothetical protein